MKYVLLGNLNAEWAAKQSERVASARGKLSDLGIEIDSMYYTQGVFDFVTTVEAPDVEAMLAFSIWYARQGYGRITTLPAFDEAAMETAVAKV